MSWPVKTLYYEVNFHRHKTGITTYSVLSHMTYHMTITQVYFLRKHGLNSSEVTWCLIPQTHPHKPRYTIIHAGDVTTQMVEYLYYSTVHNNHTQIRMAVIINTRSDDGCTEATQFAPDPAEGRQLKLGGNSRAEIDAEVQLVAKQHTPQSSWQDIPIPYPNPHSSNYTP